MKCSNCNFEVGDNNFCPNCGIKIDHSLNTSINNTDNSPKKSNKKLIIISSICIIVLIVGVILFETFFSVFEISNIKDSYTYKELVDEKLKLKTRGFIKAQDTIWNLNGYDINQGKELTNYAVLNGENTLTITNTDKTKTYKFNVDISDIQGIVVSEALTIPIDDQDFDGDGIPNSVEKEMGLATYTNDTDGDGLFDNVEIVMGLDPKVSDDYNTVRTYKVTQDNNEEAQIYVLASAKGNVANTFLDTEDLSVGFDSTFVMSDVVMLSTSNNETPEKLEIHFKTNRYNNPDAYAIYEYNFNSQELTELETFSDDDGLYANIKDYYDYLFIGRKNNEPTGEYNNQIMFVIDNSGSMFSPEYVMEKTSYTIKESDYADYGNDVEFKRISLMKSLVERLGTENFTYSTKAFTSSLCSITSASKDSEEIKKGLESLKTECQNFNGTDMSGAIRSNYRSFDTKNPGIKYMIVLTDGIDSGWFNYSLYDYELNNIKKSGVKIITIGLGDSVNSEYLQQIASSTNGKYLYASDANMLETLIGLIEQDLLAQEPVNIDGNELLLVADSGFEINKDGFSFSNFGSKDSAGGNCYGFSYLTKQIYLNNLPVSAKEEESLVSKWIFKDDAKLVAYTLTDNNKKRLVKGNVYNIKLNSEYTYFMNLDETPDDYRYIGDDNLPHISEKYRSRAINLGYEPYMKEKEITLDIDGTEKTYSSYETIGNLNLYNGIPSEDNLDDYQVLQLINRGYRVQGNHIANLIGQHIQHESKKNMNSANEFKSLMKEISSGSPAMISLTANLGGHSVLATKVYRSSDLEEYMVTIYDSNYPGVDMPARFKRIADYKTYSGDTLYEFSYVYEGSSIVFNGFLYAGKI